MGRGWVLSRIGERRQLRLLPLFFLAALGLSACNEPPKQTRGSLQTQASDQIENFLDRYWNRPLAAQGKPPAHFSTLEASLEPASCGNCHVAQFNDWRQSLHSRAMGPGILGQLMNMAPDAKAEHQDCIRCHAPLKEQADSLVASLTAGAKTSGANSAKEAPRPLHEHGLVCSACHVRGHQRYGPPRRDGKSPEPSAPLPHNGWVSSAAFEDSRFCSACHQFEKDEYALNGKLLENTYEEWKASRYAREGKTCQYCHMPERRHLWRGIHDPVMVKSGVTIGVTAVNLDSGILSAVLAIKNTGTGHYFPTYVTPKVVAEIYQENSKREMLRETLRQHVIGRQVPLDLSREIADTRIAPDEQALFDYRAPLHRNAVSLVFRVQVEPDAFYTDFYRDLLNGNQAGSGERLIKQALKDSMASAFTLYFHRESLPASAHRPSFL